MRSGSSIGGSAGAAPRRGPPDRASRVSSESSARARERAPSRAPHSRGDGARQAMRAQAASRRAITRSRSSRASARSCSSRWRCRTIASHSSRSWRRQEGQLVQQPLLLRRARPPALSQRSLGRPATACAPNDRFEVPLADWKALSAWRTAASRVARSQSRCSCACFIDAHVAALACAQARAREPPRSRSSRRIASSRSSSSPRDELLFSWAASACSARPRARREPPACCSSGVASSSSVCRSASSSSSRRSSSRFALSLHGPMIRRTGGRQAGEKPDGRCRFDRREHRARAGSKSGRHQHPRHADVPPRSATARRARLPSRRDGGRRPGSRCSAPGAVHEGGVGDRRALPATRLRSRATTTSPSVEARRRATSNATSATATAISPAREGSARTPARSATATRRTPTPAAAARPSARGDREDVCPSARHSGCGSAESDRRSSQRRRPPLQARKSRSVRMQAGGSDRDRDTRGRAAPEPAVAGDPDPHAQGEHGVDRHSRHRQWTDERRCRDQHRAADRRRAVRPGHGDRRCDRRDHRHERSRRRQDERAEQQGEHRRSVEPEARRRSQPGLQPQQARPRRAAD